MADVVNIQWFPGHMTKTKRLIQKNLPLVDIIIELVDARAPLSSSNPDLEKLIDRKPRLVLINKSDLADPEVTNRVISYYNKKKIAALALDCKSGKGLNKVSSKIIEVLTDKERGAVKKKTVGSCVRAMIVGIPNVGKSFFINRMAQKKKTKVENRPGVTRGKQWITVDDNLEFLDMPGVLWPKFEDKIVGEKLAFLGSVKDSILDIESLSARLLDFLCGSYRQKVVDRYKLDANSVDFSDSYKVIEAIGKSRKMVVSGGEIDFERVAAMILDEFRSGKLGRISLDIDFEEK